MTQGDHDPFIGYCKQHNEKSYISARKTNYLAMMSSYRVKNLGNRHMFEADPDKDRISCKFKRARENYGLAKSKLIIHSDITRKAPRYSRFNHINQTIKYQRWVLGC